MKRDGQNGGREAKRFHTVQEIAKILRVNHKSIREGIRRIGAVIAEQVELYEALTGPQTPGGAAEDGGGIDSRPNPAPSISDSPGTDSVVLPFRKTGEGAG